MNGTHPKLLTRDDFRNAVFKRDKRLCVVPNCNHNAKDAHHLIERKLWPDEGYYIENGASLCENHHKLAERNKILPLQLREWCKIQTTILPPDLAKKMQNGTEEFTKWGHMLPQPNREHPKYPTTPYLPNSPIPPEHT